MRKRRQSRTSARVGVVYYSLHIDKRGRFHRERMQRSDVRGGVTVKKGRERCARQRVVLSARGKEQQRLKLFALLQIAVTAQDRVSLAFLPVP